MTFSQLFEDHLKLAVRLHAGRSLRADRNVEAKPISLVTPRSLSAEFLALEQREEFRAEVRRADKTALTRAKYAVDALIDSFAWERFGKSNWISRTGDSHVGHNFYRNLIEIQSSDSHRTDLLDLYCVCELLGIEGADEYLRTDDDVRRALDEAVSNSRDTRFKFYWPDPAPSANDANILRAHHFACYLVPGLGALFLIALLVAYLGAWIGFPSA